MPEQPNILIFMADHQRGDTVLPEHPCITPNLDAFAAEGVTFSETFCPTPHCCPARATFMTGLYPSRHGVWNNVLNDQALNRGLAPGVRTWSEDLAEKGYRQTYTGKWHVTAEENPSDRGWAEEQAVSATAGQHHGRSWEQYRQIAEAGEPSQRSQGQILRPGYGPVTLYGTLDPAHPDGPAKDVATVSAGIEALPRLADSSQPWSLFVGATAPHDPYFAPQKYLDMYDLDDVPLPASYEDALADKPRVAKRMREQVWGQLSEREVRQAIRHFWAMCTVLDHQFGQVLDALERTGQADNTLVLYCSDHGDYCGEHGLFAKGIPCYRGAYHVPGVVRWPAGIVNPGRRVEQFVSLADFAPTFQEVGGAKVDRSLTGRSLVPFFQDQAPADWRDAVHTQCNGVELYYTQRSVTTREWKYVYNGFDDDELYDLKNDPHETVNLAGRPDMAAVKRQMCQRMWRFARQEGDTAINPYVTVGLAPYGPGVAFED